MTDREKAGLRGPARKVVSESFFVDHQTKVMPEKSGHREETAYFSDGRLESQTHRYSDGGSSKVIYVYGARDRLAEIRHASPAGEHVTHYTYDQQGLLVRVSSGLANAADTTQETYSYAPDGAKTKVFFMPVIQQPAPGEGAVGWDVRMAGESELGFGASSGGTVTTIYDVRGFPKESLSHGQRHELIARTKYVCDERGRVLDETLEPGDEPGSGLAEQVPEEMRALLEKFAASHLMRGKATHKYDEAGNEIERITDRGQLRTDKHRMRYDKYGNKVAEESESVDRPMSMNPSTGAAVPERAKSEAHQSSARYEYKYDEHGNWTEQTQWSSSEPYYKDLRSMLVKRTLTYF